MPSAYTRLAIASKDRLYRCLDRILEHKEELCRHLKSRWEDMFGIEQDTLVDVARTVPGLVGAGLVGAGLGGSIIALVEQDRVGDVIQAFERQYYRPRGEPLSAEIVRPVTGAAVLST